MADVTRLRELRRVVEAAPDDEFDMGEWGKSNSCGTARCAAGWAFVDEWFRENTEIGEIFGVTERGQVVPAVAGTFVCLGRLFGIGPDNGLILFSYRNRSKADVIDNIDRLIEGKDALPWWDQDDAGEVVG